MLILFGFLVESGGTCQLLGGGVNYFSGAFDHVGNLGRQIFDVGEFGIGRGVGFYRV